jgi:RNA polymerase sigma factor (TIGR02999 family)
LSEVTQILEALRAGQPHAADDLLAHVYQELRGIAAARMALEKSGQTLQPTALVHEAWLRLGADDQPIWQNRAHFFSAAGEAMRRILVDRARRQQCVRHGGRLERVDLEAVEIIAPEDDERLLQIHEALDEFARAEPKKAEIVKLRFFVGMSGRDVAEVLNLTERTVERHWAYAKVWILRAIQEGAEAPVPPAPTFPGG